MLKYYGMEPAQPVPAGTYGLVRYRSPEWEKYVPMTTGIPGHSYVEIHVGNYPKNTRNCLLLGLHITNDMLLDSRLAINDFYAAFFAALDKGEKCKITYVDFK